MGSPAKGSSRTVSHLVEASDAVDGLLSQDEWWRDLGRPPYPCEISQREWDAYRGIPFVEPAVLPSPPRRPRRPSTVNPYVPMPASRIRELCPSGGDPLINELFEMAMSLDAA